jgi:hypothetical protein
MFLNWHHSWDDTGDQRYIVQLGGQALVDLSRLKSPEPGHFSVAPTSLQLREDQWYFFELSTFDGTTELWIDGTRFATYTDPEPFETGTIGLEVHLFEGSNSVYTFDDLVVCGLQAPFEPMPTGEETQ